MGRTVTIIMLLLTVSLATTALISENRGQNPLFDVKINIIFDDED
jgi:hypothetical protein